MTIAQTAPPSEPTPHAFGWYDSIWLRKYFDARAIIAKVAPGRLAEFEAAMAVFRTDPAYEVKTLRGYLDEARLREMRETISAIPRDSLELHEAQKFGRLVVHDWPPFTAMQAEIAAMVSELAGEALEPCYNFLSMYLKRGVCEPHLDTPQAKWTFDLCIDQGEPWPIHFTEIMPWPESREALIEDWIAVKEGRSAHRIQSVALEPGDALLFSGPSQWHWRDPIPQAKPGTRAFCDLLFFHFIPAGTAELVEPENWARLFDLPELAEILASPATA
ncbi:MAG: hypothetical protein ACK4UL_05150 [Novosphingobium meiothermophilum]|uniref:hypothetical protein n=1 Tax=Novosphingobium TaxID=165696 RepID=UPI000D6EA8DA|nr:MULTISPECIES: hypothetical protein [Novosphingobium]